VESINPATVNATPDWDKEREEEEGWCGTARYSRTKQHSPDPPPATREGRDPLEMYAIVPPRRRDAPYA
jgi:hypothetical protein